MNCLFFEETFGVFVMACVAVVAILALIPDGASKSCTTEISDESFHLDRNAS